ncbi:uncharacterized protein LOC143458937 [Clavelina lepadiformis]|uniref:uncharacterized protein LOC143458937 n=1 Tax=Clavelina lepadiformis TaxID=159417 RepID=UPI004042780E
MQIGRIFDLLKTTWASKRNAIAFASQVVLYQYTVVSDRTRYFLLNQTKLAPAKQGQAVINEEKQVCGTRYSAATVKYIQLKNANIPCMQGYGNCVINTNVSINFTITWNIENIALHNVQVMVHDYKIK